MTEAHTTERVVRQLRRRILLGDLLPGEQLRQEQLSRALTVSRVPVREALLVLANEGLLTHYPNQGFVVTKRSPDELAQLHRLLGLLEGELLTRDFAWPNRSTLIRLRALNKRMDEIVDSVDWIDMVTLNHEFHCIIWRQSPLKLVVGEVERVWSLADAYIAQSYGSPVHRAEVVAEHADILVALAAHDLHRLRATHTAHRDSTRHGADQSIGRLA